MPEAPAATKMASVPSAWGGSVLSLTNYERDASSFHSNTDNESEEDDDFNQSRTSSERREHDRSLLVEEEEREEILRGNSWNNGDSRTNKSLGRVFDNVFLALPPIRDSTNQAGQVSEKLDGARRERRRQRRIRRKQKKEKLQSRADHGEDGELMYELESAGMKEGSSTGESSDTEKSLDIGRRGIRHREDERTRKWRKRRQFCLVHISILILFSLLVYGAWRLSSKANREKLHPKLLNNGTALFAPTTILISLDGFRADFLNRGITPRLKAFIEEGVSPLYMLPSFPSVTFPNHYTLVTGLYPESHGIVGNTFWDPELQQEFYYTDPERSMQREWWGGEPLWVTAENQGIRTAIHMWPGSEAHILGVEPSFLDKYNGKESLPSKVDRILQLLDKPGQEDPSVTVHDMRPQLIAAYVPNVDSDGHLYGPNSTEIRNTIKNVDEMLEGLFAGLEERNLTQVVNVVVVSDHGMATTSVDRLIQLEDLIDKNLAEHIDGWPLYGLRPKNPADLQELYEILVAKAASNPDFEVHLRDTTMPERYHFSKNQRIAPLWIIPKAGWAIVTKEEFDVKEGIAQKLTYHPRGLHGYDHEHPLMRAIFVARGPSFPHMPNSRVEVFQNIEVYNIICDSLGLTPKPNNGTLRLPLEPIGLHSPEVTVPEQLDPPERLPLPDATSAPGFSGDETWSISPIEASSAADSNLAPPAMVEVDPAGNDRIQNDQGMSNDNGKESQGKEEYDFWVDFLQKLEGIKDWFGSLIDGNKG